MRFVMSSCPALEVQVRVKERGSSLKSVVVVVVIVHSYHPKKALRKTSLIQYPVHGLTQTVSVMFFPRPEFISGCRWKGEKILVSSYRFDAYPFDAFDLVSPPRV
jgi:hypothetical protein